ncbi:MAG: helix-turn-helix transcriptional regulator [Anaerolineae bacterium]
MRQRQLTQTDLARLLKSSQSRVARMETGDPSVSLDLLVRSVACHSTPAPGRRASCADARGPVHSTRPDRLDPAQWL